MVSVTASGSRTPLPPAATPEIVIDSFGSSVASSTPAKVTVPVLVVWPLEMVSASPVRA